ncbi:DUF6395 domain-containing protein [Sutcliffiella horikoshii]|uniref:DUF6395 domain-containing protein n=1 Tax=Sutcliffiella horikoshii TaxID=79883 RepID=UPI003CEAA602
MTIKFIPQAGDKNKVPKFNGSFKVTKEIIFNMQVCTIKLPQDWNLHSLHPDLLALAIASIILPFCGSRLEMPIGVSNQFHQEFFKNTKKRLYPINTSLKPRKAKKTAVPALCYSGGPDSTAAMLLLPPESKLFLIKKITPKEFLNKSLLNQTAALHACKILKEKGKNVHIIESNLEFVKNPAGYPTFLTEAVPALLLADYYNLDSIANGHTIEEGYQIGYSGYQDFIFSPFGMWSSLLEVVDMPYTLPTLGLSEVAALKLILLSEFKNDVQSCSRGGINKPCMNCIKCFRKLLLRKIILKEKITDKLLDQFFNMNSVQKILSSFYPHFGNVYCYITSKYIGYHKRMMALTIKTRGNQLDSGWMEKWYPEAGKHISNKYKHYVLEQIQKNVEVMNPNEISQMKNSYSVKYCSREK